MDNDAKKRYREKNRDALNKKQRDYYYAKKNGTYNPKRRLSDKVNRKAIDEMILFNIGTTRKVIAGTARKYITKGVNNDNAINERSVSFQS